MAMNCTEFEHEWLEQIAARTPGWSSAAQQHLEHCPDCAALVSAGSLVDSAIAAWKSDPIPPAPTARILAALTAELTSRPTARPEFIPARRPTRFVSAGWVTATAATTLAIVGWSLWQQAIVPAPQPELAVTTVTNDEPVPVTATVAEFWHDVREGSASAARQTVHSWDQLPTMAPFTRTAAALPVPPDTAPPLTSPAVTRSTSSELLSGWSNLSKPLGQHVGTALQFLGTVLPSDAPPAS